MDFVVHNNNDNDDFNMVDGFHIPRSNNDPLTLPTQVSQRSWMEESMVNLNTHIGSSTNDESMNMPSQLAVMQDEIVHFYVDGGPIEEPNTINKEAAEGDTTVEAPLLVDHQPLPRNTPRLGQFLKLSVERVLKQGR